MTGELQDDEALEQRLLERDRRRAVFAGTVSHDLKTPLNAIVGFTSVLLAEPARLGQEQVRQLRLVYDSARALLERINDLLELHRLEAGLLGPEADWFLPAELVVELVEELRPRADERGVSLELELEACPARIRTDARLVRRALVELVANAIRFGGPGPCRLSAELGPAEAAGRRPLRLGVVPAGDSLAPERRASLARALDPRADPWERAWEGLGLGLALAREAARALGGHIALDGPPGEPARFGLVVPLGPGDIQA